MSELSVKASFEYVLIETNAKAAGTEIVSPSGIVTGVRQHGEEPIYGTVLSCGPDVPEEYKTLLMGKRVPLPHAQMANVPDPKLITGKATKEEARKYPVKYVTAHYKAIQAIYE